MSFTELKDYYKTMELLPSAKAEEIKKAYRKLALKYHPDTNSSDYAAAHFREIKEAYEVLSHPEKRRKYDEERWLNGMGNRARDQVVVTPEWILHECRRLSKHMETIDTYRMSHSALNDYIFLLLSDAHMAVLLQTEDADVKKDIVSELLKSVKGIKYQYMEPIASKLAELVPHHNEMLQKIYTQINASKKQASWEKRMPVIIVIVTLLLCVLMFFYSKK